MFIGLILIALGVIFLLRNLGIITVGVWQVLWPAILIIIGLSFVFKGRPWWESPWHYMAKKWRQKFEEKWGEEEGEKWGKGKGSKE